MNDHAKVELTQICRPSIINRILHYSSIEKNANTIRNVKHSFSTLLKLPSCSAPKIVWQRLIEGMKDIGFEQVFRRLKHYKTPQKKPFFKAEYNSYTKDDDRHVSVSSKRLILFFGRIPPSPCDLSFEVCLPEKHYDEKASIFCLVDSTHIARNFTNTCKFHFQRLFR